MRLDCLWNFFGVFYTFSSSQIHLGFLGDFTTKSHPFNPSILLHSSFTHIAYGQFTKGLQTPSFTSSEEGGGVGDPETPFLTFPNPDVLTEMSKIPNRPFALGSVISAGDLDEVTVEIVVDFAKSASLSFIVIQWVTMKKSEKKSEESSILLKAVERLSNSGLKIFFLIDPSVTLSQSFIDAANWIIIDYHNLNASQTSTSHSIASSLAIESTLDEFQKTFNEHVESLKESYSKIHQKGALMTSFNLVPYIAAAAFNQEKDVASWRESGKILEWPSLAPQSSALRNSSSRRVLECKDYIAIAVKTARKHGLGGIAFFNVALYWQE